MNTKELQDYTNEFWENEILDTLKTYIEIPNKSVDFDPDWEKNGYVDQALKLVVDWLEKHPVEGAEIKVDQIPGRTPIILIDVPGEADGNVLMYGHLDKQPEMEGWREGLAPWKAVMEGDKLYGRGGADDGYAIFSCICALSALKKFGQKHPPVKILVEFSEESGSKDLEVYVEKYKDFIGDVSLVIALDSSTGDYERFWITTSLRGMLRGNLRVEVLNEGVHSGNGSGIVPSSFRIARELLERLEDSKTGRVLLEDLHAEIPAVRAEQAASTGEALGAKVFGQFPTKDDLKPMADSPKELLLNQTWRPTLSYVGADGLPPNNNAGNVLRPYTDLKLSFRIPPTLDAKVVAQKLEEVLNANPPQGATVKATFPDADTGWHSPIMSDELDGLMHKASQEFYGHNALYRGEGGSIPFMGMLGDMFPQAEFVITGVLGPASNAHGPNEFLHVPYVKKLTACVTYILANYQKK